MAKELKYKHEKREVSSYDMKKITTRVPEETLVELKAYCEERKISIQQLLERYIDDVLGK